jgi:hypothetical protein
MALSFTKSFTLWSKVFMIARPIGRFRIVSQKELEVILTRQLASCLATPVFIVDANGVLVYYNEPAEMVLGHHFDETGEMGVTEWGSLFEMYDKNGVAVSVDNLPLVVTLRNRVPSFGDISVRGLDGRQRHLQVMAVPLIGQAKRFLGAMAMFWELEDKP